MSFTVIILLTYLVLAYLYWIAGIALTWVMVRKLPPLAPSAPGLETSGDLPPLQILVAARNEELEIDKCLRSLLAQDYPDLRILLADDGSTDGTRQIAEAIAAGDDRLEILSPGEPPPGWVGKCWALHQAFQEAERRGYAQGSILLFTDADAIFHPRALSVAVGRLREEGLDLVALLPKLVNETFWEKCLQPSVFHGLLGAGILSEIFPSRKFPRLASGAFLLVRPEAYLAVGGHLALRHQIIEDVTLATRVHLKSGRTRSYWAPDLLRIRMYHGFKELWLGWSKTFFAGTMDRLPVAMGMFLVILLFSTLPPLVLAGLVAFAAATGAGWPLAGAAAILCILMTGVRWWGNRFMKEAPIFALLHPLAGAVTVAVLVASTWSRRFGRGTLWRGRRYAIRKPAG